MNCTAAWNQNVCSERPIPVQLIELRINVPLRTKLVISKKLFLVKLLISTEN